MNHSEFLETIAGHPFFSGMSEEHLRTLGELAMPVHFEAGEDIFRTKDSANRFYLIRRGQVAIGSFPAEGRSITIQMIGQGEVLGWSWLFPPYEWQFDARAIERTEAVFFYGTPLRELCESNARLACDLMQRFAGIILQRLQATRLELIGQLKT